jgi:RNA polymerase sigma factor (sigma-70 family)
MAETGSVTQEGLELLLTWLGEDPETGGRVYEKIRQRLIRVFAGRGCYEPDHLADITFDRVAAKLPVLSKTYVGDPALYFYGVANHVHHEWLRRQRPQTELTERTAVIASDADDEREVEFDCLEKCLAQLPSRDREMIVEYYRDEKRAKIDRRKKLADRLEISIGALQTKASRIRARLLECVKGCASARGSRQVLTRSDI